MALVELVIERIDLDRRIARRRVGLYAGDVIVTDAATCPLGSYEGEDRTGTGRPPARRKAYYKFIAK